MKLHLPVALIRRILSLSLLSVPVSMAKSAAYPLGELVYTAHQTAPLAVSEYAFLSFVNIRCEANGAAVSNAPNSENAITLTNNGVICFEANDVNLSEESYGGAIYNIGLLSVNGNGSIIFKENTTHEDCSAAAFSCTHMGGGIYNHNIATFNENRSVTFSGNKSGFGGAVRNDGNFAMNDNGAVSFDGNSALTEGAAIANGAYGIPAEFQICGNEKVEFLNNSAIDEIEISYGAEANGGAISNNYGSIFRVIDNATVIFEHNMASNGGCVDNGGDFTFENNGDIVMKENVVYTAFGGGTGGGISNGGRLTILNNSSFSVLNNTAAFGAGINNSGTMLIDGNEKVDISGNYSEFSSSGAIFNGGTMVCQNNKMITIFNNSSYDNYFSSSGMLSGGSAALNYGTMSYLNNGTVSIRGNDAGSLNGTACGGAIYNEGNLSFQGNSEVLIVGNSSQLFGGAIYNSGSLRFCENQTVDVSGNYCSAFAEVLDYSAAGSAFYNDGGLIEIVGNGDVIFSRNIILKNDTETTLEAWGGCIYNAQGTIRIADNGNVLFLANGEQNWGTGDVRLRSIYSDGELNLSASIGKTVTFADAIYATGSVNLNQEGSGDIVFTGAFTEKSFIELRGYKASEGELLSARTSEIATEAMLYGGRLVVEDGCILKGYGITATDSANAVIRLNGGTLDETGYAIAVSSGSGLEFEGGNVLKAGSVQMADGAFLSFVMGEGAGTDWDAQLTTGQLHVQVSGDLFNAHQLLTLADASQYDTSRWTSDSVTVSGASFDSLRWDAGVLTYTPHVIPPGEDGALDDVLPNDGHAVIDGNGHTLTVKNEVQLVQMALKDGIVRLEGENNGIVSVTLTEGGELVLSAGAGLTTGDIISMVASGKGELVISGDITLDNKGMKGKEGKHATVSHADMQVQGDASISHVRVEDSTIDVAEGCTVNFSQVVLAATARLTDEPATAVMDEVTAELMMGVNTSKMADGVLPVGALLVQNGNTAQTLSPEAEATVVQLEATTFDSLTLTGSSLVLELRGLETELYNGADYIALSFTSGKSYATFEDGLAVLLSTDGEHYAQGHYLQGGDHTTLYFDSCEAGMAPEPATATLSLLALAALAARRKRK